MQNKSEPQAMKSADLVDDDEATSLQRKEAGKAATSIASGSRRTVSRRKWPIASAIALIVIVVIIGFNVRAVHQGQINDDVDANSHNGVNKFDFLGGPPSSKDSVVKELDERHAKPDDPTQRFYQRGYPLVDKWRRSSWRLTKEEHQRLLGWIGYPGKHGRCKSASSKTQVISVIQSRGFGSNILGLADDITYSAVMHRRFVLMSRRNQTVRNQDGGEKKVVFALAFERVFSFTEENDTLCTNWGEVCEGSFAKKELCKGPSHLWISKPTLESLKFSDGRLFFGARVELMRLLLRVREPIRLALDQMISPIQHLVASDTTSIVIHVRRTDKYLEAAPTPVVDYVKAALHALRSSRGKRLDSLIVITDDSQVGRAVIHQFNTTAARREHPALGYLLRDGGAQKRPDRADDDEVEEAGMIEMLTDLRLMVMAKYFVGTQSSNFGLMACYLRGGVSCINAETRAEPYIWAHLKDKLT